MRCAVGLEIDEQSSRRPATRGVVAWRGGLHGNYMARIPRDRTHFIDEPNRCQEDPSVRVRVSFVAGCGGKITILNRLSQSPVVRPFRPV
jgi:hypothetical protein